ncbi:HutD/Ves family protein [Ruegeria marina]|uniref:HutD protein n=1 Tax=Ruegeria marina TaxID=639004 RepID=A0A1G6IZ03_9RHOB|nr:HutD family protein [Ruegeria marina]SDC11748.1 hypothetical protein SAMN04488239_101237 [Ruegeria marina]
MRVLDPLTLASVPWRNGGGVTREIAGNPPLWRLSLADVASEGPFSVFAGLRRILTVIEGAGMELHFEQRTEQARFGQPLSFSGDEPIAGRLPHGPVRDLNLIFDPGQVIASVAPVSGPRTLPVYTDEVALHVLSGRAGCDGMDVTGGRMILHRTAPLELDHDTLALRVTVSRRP